MDVQPYPFLGDTCLKYYIRRLENQVLVGEATLAQRGAQCFTSAIQENPPKTEPGVLTVEQKAKLQAKFQKEEEESAQFLKELDAYCSLPSPIPDTTSRKPSKTPRQDPVIMLQIGEESVPMLTPTFTPTPSETESASPIERQLDSKFDSKEVSQSAIESDSGSEGGLSLDSPLPLSEPSRLRQYIQRHKPS